MNHQKIAKNLLLNHSCNDCFNIVKTVVPTKDLILAQIIIKCKFESKIPDEEICDKYEPNIQYGSLKPIYKTNPLKA